MEKKFETGSRRRVRCWLRTLPCYKLFEGLTFLVTKKKGTVVAIKVPQHEIVVSREILARGDFRLLCLDLYDILVDKLSCGAFQGSQYYNLQMSELSQAVLVRAVAKGAAVNLGTSGYNTVTLAPINDDPLVKATMEKVLEERGVIEDWKSMQRTDEVVEIQRYVDGAAVHLSDYCDNPDLSTDDDIFWLYADMCYHGPREKAKVIPPDPIAMSELKVRDSSVGYFASGGQDKKSLFIQGCIDVCEVAQGLRPPSFAPTSARPKGEVIGNEKKVRYIQVEEIGLYLIATCMFGDLLNKLKVGLEGGEAIGVPTNKGYGLRLFSRLTQSWSLPFKESWDEFKMRKLDESDKKSWEATRKFNLALVCVLFYLTKIEDVSSWGAAGAAYLVHHLFAFVGWSGDHCLKLKGGQLTSGTLLTARSNTDYHKLLIKAFFQFVCSHEGEIGKEGCCDKCDALGKEFEYTEKDALELVSAVVMGDDYLSLRNVLSEAFALFCDNYFGTVTIGEEKNWDEAEFLKRRMTDIRGYPSTRRVKHVIGKLKGPHSISLQSKIASTISAAVDCNDKEVHGHMKALHTELISGLGATAEVDAILRDGYKGVNSFNGFPSFENIQANHIPRELDVVQMAKNAKKLKMHFDL